jgi:phosphoribosylformylglycinamidine cyclo-ligase
VLPEELVATVDRGTWTPHPVFELVGRVGGVAQPDLESALNCGVGMVAVVDPDDADRAIALLEGHGVTAWVCGEAGIATGAADAPAGGSVTLRGGHPGW